MREGTGREAWEEEGTTMAACHLAGSSSFHTTTLPPPSCLPTVQTWVSFELCSAQQNMGRVKSSLYLPTLSMY